MSQAALHEAIRAGSVDVDGKKKLPCIKAFEIAAAFDLKAAEIGSACNELSIKICACQFGCFR
jgi:hypothetical protein